MLSVSLHAPFFLHSTDSFASNCSRTVAPAVDFILDQYSGTKFLGVVLTLPLHAYLDVQLL